MKRRRLASAIALTLCLFLWGLNFGRAEEPRAVSSVPAAIEIGSRLELFVDDLLIERLNGASLKLHDPLPSGTVLRFDAPWEGPFCAYVTVLRDGSLFRMYYRGLRLDGADGSTNEVTCVAESGDGLTWVKPKLVWCLTNNWPFAARDL